MELEMEEAPLALIGDYFNEWSLDSAYLSGLYLAEYWITKFKDKMQQQKAKKKGLSDKTDRLRPLRSASRISTEQ